MLEKNGLQSRMDFALLQKYGVPVLPYKMACSLPEAKKAAAKIGYPVALKIISDKILHKSEFRAISLNVKDEHSLASEYKRLEGVAGKENGKILVQKFVHPKFELIVGGKTDPQFGPTIMIGLGGIYTEIFQDVSIRVCPPSENDVRSMISQLRAFQMLKGARGQKGISLSQLASILHSVSKLMESEQPKELDINPLFATREGLVAGDVRVLR